MNIGFLEALHLQDFDCFVFHDVDLLPLDTRQPYTCFKAPTHLGAYMSKFDYKYGPILEIAMQFILSMLFSHRMPYDKFFGGAVALSKENMHHMNGFSNNFFGWGGEDDDTFNR